MEPAVNMVKMPKPDKVPALVERVAKEQQLKAKRKQQADIAARKAAAELAARKASTETSALITDDVTQKSTLAEINSDMTFARAGMRYAHTDYMRSRRIGG
jgi:hypothetical protein